ncbi:3-oxoacyl-ACP reductase [Zhengella mangrovi]|uniref:3-oxoacyl-ACP reductase n=1 Tax=Zhengella mangrovi TaxID=1982044 RepID=A0A2G1QMN8_9HYPH|nr:SDR family oxidoreductase [Zhengella mangrovi]PHP66783.1 3-oxoacyl-ACP reductase [Zhengella mangrovi]
MFDPKRFHGLLTGDIAVVTGAAMGNGAAIAGGLAASGAKVVLADLNPEVLQQTVDTMRKDGAEVTGVRADVSSLADCEALAGAAAEAFGDVSILINNAGIVKRVPAQEEGFISSIERQLAVNALGSANMVKAFLPQLTRTRGRVVNIGSIASFVATTGGVGYGMSKGAALLLTKTLAAELAPVGIRVNGIAPGVIKTPMTKPTRANPESVEKYFDHIPFRRFGEPEELVGPVLFLVSSQSTYVTGVMLPVDGGFSAV